VSCRRESNQASEVGRQQLAPVGLHSPAAEHQPLRRARLQTRDRPPGGGHEGGGARRWFPGPGGTCLPCAPPEGVQPAGPAQDVVQTTAADAGPFLRPEQLDQLVDVHGSEDSQRLTTLSAEAVALYSAPPLPRPRRDDPRPGPGSEARRRAPRTATPLVGPGARPPPVSSLLPRLPRLGTAPGPGRLRGRRGRLGPSGAA
jgi:hypothetical protein